MIRSEEILSSIFQLSSPARMTSKKEGEDGMKCCRRRSLFPHERREGMEVGKRVEQGRAWSRQLEQCASHPFPVGGVNNFIRALAASSHSARFVLEKMHACAFFIAPSHDRPQRSSLPSALSGAQDRGKAG